MSAAGEIAALLKRTFAVYRLYGPDHDSATQAEANLHERLAASLESAKTMRFDVESERLLSNGAVVLVDDRPEESITRPAFSDGVAAFVLTEGVTIEELRTLLRFWNQAVTRTIGPDHTLSTLLWEMEASHIDVAFQPSLAEHGVGSGAAENAVSRLVREVMESAELHAPLHSVDRAALDVLGAHPAFRDVDRAALVERAQADDTAIHALSNADRLALVSGLATSSRGIGQRALLAMWRCLEIATPAERTRLVDLVTDAVDQLVARRRIAEVTRALIRVVQTRDAPRDDPDLRAFLACLRSAKTVGALVESMTDPSTRADATVLLHYVPDDTAEVLVGPTVDAPSDVRVVLLQILERKAIEPERVAGWVVVQDTRHTEVLLQLAERLGPEHHELALRAALVHDEPRARVIGIEGIQTERVAGFRTLLLRALDEPAPDVRRAALDALIRAKDPIAATTLARQLGDDAVAIDEKRTVVRALGRVGGPIANTALRRTLESTTDRGLRLAVIGALGQAKDVHAVPLLETYAHRFFGDRRTKRACRAAIERIEADDDA